MPDSKDGMHLMKALIAGVVASVAFASAFSPFALGHAPLGAGDNEALGDATLIPNAEKSWAVYAELHEAGEAQYYKFDVTSGQRLYLMLYASPGDADAGFLPHMALMAPGIDDEGSLPKYVILPEGYGYRTVPSKRAEKPSYEAFAPGSFYSLSELRFEAGQGGTYYVVVFEEKMGGRYGLAVGEQESFTIEEYLLIPFSTLNVYLWSGQSPIQVIAPMAAVVAIGIVTLYLAQVRTAVTRSAGSALAYVAGLIFVGSAAVKIYVMLVALSWTGLVGDAMLTVTFVLAPLGIGAYAMKYSLGGRHRSQRVKMVIFALLGLISWGGFLVGPAIAVAAAITPSSGGQQRTSLHREQSG